ncbi:Hypothetical protein PENO1_107850 [Penicillium occitanis (nom. inval.)]|nr:Hypothetical protein PENO1_107850 [Penicillium occitanis (nom. inval.)]PCG89118.1 hypothetical protein PENOC_107980 [Penicillium occitanis (nom. inval.)]
MNPAAPPVKRRACVACTAAKAKCSPQTVDMCQRCARLGKSCIYLEMPQTKRKRKTAPSRVELLEKQVEQLTSQLAVLTRKNGQTLPETFTPVTNNDLGSSHNPDLDSTDIGTLIEAAKEPGHGIHPPTSSVLDGQLSIVERGLISEAEAERLVTTYRLTFVYRFPFVLLAPSDTAARLRHREPFLFLCVVAAAMSSAHPLRKIVTEEIMKHITLRIVAHSERSLELLRGLLVHTAWYSYPAELHHTRLLLLIQFCVSILYDLRLNLKPDMNLDEQRALLGTYWMSYGLSYSLGRPTGMKQDARIDECVASLASTEHLSDRCIAPFIRLQSFVTTMDEMYASVQASSGSAFVQIMRGTLQRQFDSMRTIVEKDVLSCPPSAENTVRIEMKRAEMRLEELSLREDLWIAQPASAVRTTMLTSMVQRSKELLHMIKNLPLPEIDHLTITTSAHLCAAMGYMPMAVMSLVTNISTGSADSAMETQVQAVVDMADYPNLVTDLANTLETKLEGMPTADKEADMVGSIFSKMRLLATCYPYQIKAIIGNAPMSQDARQDTSRMALDANEGAMTQAWPSINGDADDMLPIDDLQWDQLIGYFTGAS